MLNAMEILEGVSSLKEIGDKFIVPCTPDKWQETRKEIDAIVRPWEITWGGELLCDRDERGVSVNFVAIKNGSPLKARVQMPWFGMQVGDSRRVDLDGKKLASIRSAVSIFCSKMGQQINVSQYGTKKYDLYRSR